MITSRTVNPPSESRRELDSAVVNIELTLTSIIQGVALFFLTDNARAAMSVRHWESFLYVVAGLCVIFIFWSRSIIHTLTLIKWPLEFGHNFFYIACALGEAILFSRLDSPLAWFQLSAAYAGIVWLLFIYDMRLIGARISESNNDADRALYARAGADQLLNIWVLVPLLFLLNIGCAFAIWRWPDVFITRAGHVWLIGIQLVSFVIYLVYIARYFNAIAPLLLRSREGAGER
jgi:hypothetical protein